MLSRIADSLYWMNRYVERTDGLLRMLRVGYLTSFDASKETTYTWKPVLTVYSLLKPEKIEEIERDTPKAIHQMFLHVEEHNSVKVLITRARENARGTQDHITKEVWEAVNNMYHKINGSALIHTLQDGDQIAIFNDFIQDCLKYYGVTDITMPRSTGWDFMSLGRYTERCLQTLAIADETFKRIDYSLDDSHHIVFWKNMLLCLSGYELYLKTYRTGNHTENIVNMIFFNPEFPRSIFYSIQQLNIHIQNILRDSDHENKRLLERKMGALLSTVSFADLADIKADGIQHFIENLKNQLTEIQQIIGQSFFAYY